MDKLGVGAMNDTWIIKRIGLLNFWYYDEEEFSFLDGRLLLRGSNGSGKSVTMQSFIPLLLDGNKSPERLDPFGSRARRLENYLLGEDEDVQEENTGYLYMEFYKKDSGHHLTIGMGLKARRGRSLDFWGFAITDGRRIGRDFFLYRELGEKIPLSKTELKNRIGAGGEVHEGQGEYMAMVNRLLFGFESIEDYDELIKLLVQLRTPKLSKDFKPTVIYEIMNNSLQPLSDEDLRPMSEAIENMDNIKDQLEILKVSKKAVDRLKSEYDRYNRYVLYEKAKDLVNSQDGLDRLLKEAQHLNEEKQEYQKLQNQAEQEWAELKSDQERLEHKKAELEEHDSFKANQELERLANLLEELTADKAVKEKGLQDKQEKERKLRQDIRETVGRKEQSEDEFNRLLGEMSQVAEPLHLYEHDFFAQELISSLDNEYNFNAYRKEIDIFRKRVEEAKQALEVERSKSLAYDHTLEEVEAARREKEKAGRELEKTELVFAETKAEFIEHAYSWEKGNEYLKIPTDIMPWVVRSINAYGQSGGYDDILREISKQYSSVESYYNENLAKIKTNKLGLEEQLQVKHQELQEWKGQKEPEPLRESKVQANRSSLEQEGIPFIPFYMAVDFQKDVPADVRGRLEEALVDMGMLDALIVPPQYLDKVKVEDPEAGDRYLIPKPSFFKQDLSLLLKPVVAEGSSITFENIDNVLKSIMLNKETECVYINEQGEYSIGLLQGKTSSQYIPRYLGAEARKQYRQENILRLEQECNEILTSIAEQAQQIQDLERIKTLLKKELEAFPGKEDLETALNMVNSCSLSLDSKTKETARREEQADGVYKELKAAKDRVRELIRKLEIVPTLEAFTLAREDINNYRDLLGRVETLHVKLMQLLSTLQSLNNQVEDILLDIEDLSLDLKKIARNIQDNNNKKKNYEELLAELHYEQIQEEIARCLKGLREIPGKLEAATRNAAIYKEKQNYLLAKLSENEAQINYQRKLSNCYQAGFRQEYGLGYVFAAEENPEITSLARKVYSELKVEEKTGKLREDYAGALQERYHDNRQHISEYNLIMEYNFESYEEQGDERLDRVLASRKRLELKGRIQGRDVNFYHLVSFIEEAISENEKLLKESDRQLFEDILANTVGKKIRARIYHSEQWVKKMNKLMESMNTSSGLSFSLFWKSKAAETEEQIDTKELVDILKADAQLLSEDQMDKLSSHFRSKIAQGRKELEEKGATQSFHAIMKDILDYRKWFQFQLFYRKTGEQKKELTNNAFDKFSGGEKAMAMYVPLFSSVYARYEGARPDSPRIISLDEAFAGVDENNIRDMFRLIEELKLNFIINSQILWGDYDTIPALSVCELVRPNNADFVTVIRYRWNGKVRELLTDKAVFEQELDEIAAAGEV